MIAIDAGECLRIRLHNLRRILTHDGFAGDWGSRGGGGRGGEKMVVRVLHLRELAQLHQVHHVQGLKAPQGDRHHPAEYLLKHTGLQTKYDQKSQPTSTPGNS